MLTSSGGNGFFNDLISSSGNIGVYNYAGAAVGFGGSGITGAAGLAAAQNAAAAGGGSAAAAATPAGLGASLGGALAGSLAPEGTASLGVAPVLAGVGQASMVGGLSVPASWSAATPEVGTAATFTGADWHPDFGAGGPVTNVATGMPAVASTGRGGSSFSTPRYGVKHTVMPQRVLV